MKPFNAVQENALFEPKFVLAWVQLISIFESLDHSLYKISPDFEITVSFGEGSLRKVALLQ